MKKLVAYLKPYKYYIAAAVFFLFLHCLTQLMLPGLMAKMVDVGIVEGDIDYIYKMGAYMLVLTILSMLCSVAAGYFTAQSSSGFAKLLRRDLFSKVEYFSLNQFDRFGTSTLVTRTTNDVSQIQNVIMMMLRIVVVASLTFFSSLILMLGKDAAMSLVVLLVIPILAAFVYIVSRKIMPMVKEMQNKLDGLSRILRERLTGVRVIRAFNKEKAANNQYGEANDDLMRYSLKVNRIVAILLPGMSFLMNLTTIAVLWYGSLRIETAHLTIGDMMAFIQYVAMIMMSVIMFSFIFIIIPRAKVSADRILEILDVEPEILDPEKSSSAAPTTPVASAAPVTPVASAAPVTPVASAAPVTPVASAAPVTPVAFVAPAAPAVFAFDGSVPAVEFRNVSFRYNDSEAPVLKNISFSVGCGETVAIIGGMGSGKTSLISLIPRFYDVFEGAVLVGGADVRYVPQKKLRENIGFVPQTAVLFSGTIEENIRYGKENATEEEIWKALEIAQAVDFVENMDEGVHSYISQGGTNVSGGQKQRLTIARAIVGRPEIYIFDDNFSALDYKTDANLRHSLNTEIQGAAVIIVAQRVATIRNVSKIIVLDGGQIAGIGTDAELMKSCEIYRKIVASQIGSDTAPDLSANISNDAEAAE